MENIAKLAVERPEVSVPVAAGLGLLVLMETHNLRVAAKAMRAMEAGGKDLHELAGGSSLIDLAHSRTIAPGQQLHLQSYMYDVGQAPGYQRVTMQRGTTGDISFKFPFSVKNDSVKVNGVPLDQTPWFTGDTVRIRARDITPSLVTVDDKPAAFFDQRGLIGIGNAWLRSGRYDDWPQSRRVPYLVGEWNSLVPAT